MSLRINNNVEAFNTHRQLVGSSEKMAKSMERLSSGSRINRAADDAAGLAISEGMRGQIKGLAQAQRNAQDGVSLVQTAEGALNEVHSMLQRVRELKVQHDNGTLAAGDKTAIAAEAKQLTDEITNIQTNTKFNGISLLTGTGGPAGSAVITLQAGANTGETIAVTTSNLTSGATGTVLTGTVDDTAFTALTLTQVDAAITQVSTQRASFGSSQNRLDHRIASLANYQENLISAESRIRDVDMAQEMVEFTKSNILQQAGTSMLSQANQAPQSVLSLLR
jgi:flagellin